MSNKVKKVIDSKVFFVFLIIFMSVNIIVKADDNNLFAQHFGNNSRLMYALGHGNSMIGDFFRDLGWKILMLLGGILNFMGGILEEIVGIDVLHLRIFNKIDPELAKVMPAVMWLTLTFTSLVVTIRAKGEWKRIFISFFLIIIINTSLLPITQELVSNIGNPIMAGAKIDNQFGTEIIIDNTYDIQRTLQNDRETHMFGYDGSKKLTEKQWIYLLFGNVPKRVVDNDEVPNKYKNKFSDIEDTGDYIVRDYNAGWFNFGIGDTHIYRYDFNFWSLFIQMLILIFAIFFVTFRVTRALLWEIPIAYFTVKIKSLFTWQPEKLLSLVGEFLMLFGMVYVNLYFIYAYILIVNDPLVSSLTGGTFLFVNLVLAFGLIQGSSFVLKMTGIGTGVSVKDVIAMNQTMEAINNVGEAVGDLTRLVAGLGGSKGTDNSIDNTDIDNEGSQEESKLDKDRIDDVAQGGEQSNDDDDMDKSIDDSIEGEESLAGDTGDLGDNLNDVDNGNLNDIESEGEVESGDGSGDNSSTDEELGMKIDSEVNPNDDNFTGNDEKIIDEKTEGDDEIGE